MFEVDAVLVCAGAFCRRCRRLPSLSHLQRCDRRLHRGAGTVSCMFRWAWEPQLRRAGGDLEVDCDV